jgi:hypothetical protein
MPDKKRADRKARVVEHLPIKYEARVQTPVPPKKKKKKNLQNHSAKGMNIKKHE